MICSGCRRGSPPTARFCGLADKGLEIAAPTQSRKFESWAWRIEGESDDALAYYRAAWTIIADLGAKTRDRELGGGLESAPLVVEVRDLAS